MRQHKLATHQPVSSATPHLEHTGYTAWGFAAAFLLGYLPGVLAGRTGTSALAEELAAFYMNSQRFSAFVTVFAGFYATAFLRLSLTMLCGLSALGIPLLTFSFALRGAFLGLGATGVFAAQGAKGLVIHWLLNFLPELALLFLTLWLSGYAARLAGGLFRDVFLGGAARNALSAAVRRVLTRYMIGLMIAAVLCLISAGLDILLARVLL